MGAFGGPEIVKSGLVLALDAGNTRSYPGTGTTWSDLSGNNNNFTWVSAPAYTSSGFSSYFSTLGNRCKGPASNAVGITNTSGYTIFIVCKRNALTQSGAFKFYNNGTFNRGIFAHITWTDGTIYWDQGGCCSVDTRTTYANAGAESWNVWAFRRQTNGNTRTIFKNGSVVSTNANAAANLNLNATQIDLASSDEFGGNSSTWNAQLHAFLVYNRELTDAETIQITNLYKIRFGL